MPLAGKIPEASRPDPIPPRAEPAAGGHGALPHDHLDLSAALMTKLQQDTQAALEGHVAADEKPEADATPEGATKARAGTKTETKPETSPEAKAETKPETSPEAKSETKAETKTPEDGIREAVVKPTRWKTPAMRIQEEVIGKAIAGEAVSFPTLDERTIDVRIDKREPKPGAPADRASFTMTVAGNSFELNLRGDLDAPDHIARAVEYYAKVPEHLRPLLKTLDLEPAPNPGDAEWARIFGVPTFASAATAGGGKITIWNLQANPLNLSEGIFDHEMGHLIGESHSTSRTRHAEMIPPGWEAAMEADGKRVSAYAEHNANEDFADTWRFYLLARRHPEQFEEFRKTYPNRVKILDAIYEQTFDGKPKLGDFSSEPAHDPHDHDKDVRHV
jgi:hypothetical protein